MGMKMLNAVETCVNNTRYENKDEYFYFTLITNALIMIIWSSFSVQKMSGK